MFDQLIDKLSKILMVLYILYMLRAEKQYEECVEGGGSPLACWMGLGEPWWIPKPPRPIPHDVLQAASYVGLLKDMRALALETIDIIDGLLKEPEHPF